jgi:hypothetical protein
VYFFRSTQWLAALTRALCLSTATSLSCCKSVQFSSRCTQDRVSVNCWCRWRWHTWHRHGPRRPDQQDVPWLQAGGRHPEQALALNYRKLNLVHACLPACLPACSEMTAVQSRLALTQLRAWARPGSTASNSVSAKLLLLRNAIGCRLRTVCSTGFERKQLQQKVTFHAVQSLIECRRTVRTHKKSSG